MRLGPDLLLAVTVDKGGILNSLPPQEAAWRSKDIGVDFFEHMII
jgi:hypothetical protein